MALVVLSGVPAVQSIHEFSPHTTAPPTCEPVALSSSPLYERPLVRTRWDRASAVAPNVCLLPLGGAWWDCQYVEAVPDDTAKLCWWPARDESAFVGDGSRLEVFVDLAMLRKLAQSAIIIPQVKDLLGGSAEVEVRVGPESARLHIENGQISQAYLLNPPPTCTPVTGITDPGAPSDARGVCASRVPSRAGACRFIMQAPDADAFLCWWGRAAGGADFVIEVSPDALRG
ncbi:MAG TPA: hypothetical protein VI818_08655, partial [Candidatus Thermoplasmatota archaeon]|nr:hypothetical protein [Candidatus Thermoplasmatota archaeon]